MYRNCGEKNAQKREMDEKIGKTVRQLRELRGMSREQLGEKIGVSSGSIGLYERGLSSPRVSTLAKLIDVLDADANTFFGRRSVYLSELEKVVVLIISNLSYEQRQKLADRLTIIKMQLEREMMT